MSAYDSVFSSPDYWVSLAAGVVGISLAAWQERGAVLGSRSMKNPSLAEIRAAIRPLGMKVRRVDGEYRVAWVGLKSASDEEGAAYYTTDATDALETARDMARVRDRHVAEDAERARARGGSGSRALTPARKAQLQNLKHKLRGIVFEQDEGSARGEKARRLLQRTRERIVEDEAPERQAGEKRAAAERRARDAYLRVALATPKYYSRSQEREQFDAFERLAGGRDRAYQLKRLWDRVQDGGVRTSLEIGDDATYEARLVRQFAIAARRDGFSAEAVRALLGAQR